MGVGGSKYEPNHPREPTQIFLSKTVVDISVKISSAKIFPQMTSNTSKVMGHMEASLTIKLATSVELSPTAASWDRMSASRSSSALPTGPKTVLSRITMRRRNSEAMMGSVRLKSNILPGSPASEGRTMTAFVRIVATVGFTTFESSDLLLLKEKVMERSQGQQRGDSSMSGWIIRAKECKTQLMLALVCGGKLPDISLAVHGRPDSVGSYRKKNWSAIVPEGGPRGLWDGRTGANISTRGDTFSPCIETTTNCRDRSHLFTMRGAEWIRKRDTMWY